MVQQTVESKCNEYGLGNPEINPEMHDKQHPVAVKKTALRELQNENRIMVPKSPYVKEKAPLIDPAKVSGIKRPPQGFITSPSRDQSANTISPNGHLVYVRRKFEADLGKSGSDGTNISTQQIKEPKVCCFPAFAPMPMTSLISSSGKPTIPPFAKSMNSASKEGNYHAVTSSPPPSDDSRGIKNLNWEERGKRLQAVLKHLDGSDQGDYVQMLWSLSSVELSRHAVELEKRSIQLSLEEAREMNRVAALNVLGKSGKHLKSPSVPLPSQTNNRRL